MAYTNADIVPAALQGRDAHTASGNFQTYSVDEFRARYGYTAPHMGHPPRSLQKVLRARYGTGSIRQIIVSYQTPIAWLDGDVWIVPNVTYSVTTSAKHQSQLYRLPNARRVAWDTPLDEYMRVLDGLMVYTDKGTRAA